MADNTQLSAGTADGAVIATDDITSVHYQKVKLVDGTADSTTVIAAGGGVEATALRVTLASDSTGVVSVDDNAGSLTVDNADITTIAGAVSGTEMQVDVVAALPAGTNAIGKLAANSGVDIGDVDVLSVAGTVTVGGVAAENAAVSGSPVLTGGRYDATPRTLGDGDVGAIALDADGAVQISDGGNTLTVDGSGVTQPVSGTVTANLSATDNTVLDNIDTNTTGLAGCVGGSELQVDVVGALPAGTNAIGKLAANSGVDIGDVDILSVVPGSGATNLGKAIDVAAGGSDVGIAALGVRDDALTAVTPADGDYIPFRASAYGAAYTAPGNFLSTNNSTTATLGISASYTGTGDDCLGFTAITIQLDSSHDSAASGMTFEFSSDNTNWDDVYTFTYTAADGARRFQFPVTARYFRVNYTNGGTGQTHFRVQTILHAASVPTSVHRLGDDASADRSATVVKAALLAQAAGSGDFTPIDATSGGNLKVSISEASDGLDIGAGNAGTETIRVSVATDDVNLSGILADTAAMDTNLTTVAGAVSGTEMQVDVVASLPAGTNAIGKLAANSGVDIGDVDVLSQPARDNATDTITASLDTSAIMNDTTALTPKFAKIDVTSSGDNSIVAAVVGKKIRVLQYVCVSTAALSLKFRDGTTDLQGAMAVAANSGVGGGFCPVGHFETTANTALNLNLSGATQVSGSLVYVEV